MHKSLINELSYWRYCEKQKDVYFTKEQIENIDVQNEIQNEGLVQTFVDKVFTIVENYRQDGSKIDQEDRQNESFKHSLK